MDSTNITPRATMLTSSQNNRVFADAVNMYKSYICVTNLSRPIMATGEPMVHNLWMLFLVIFTALYALIHVKAKQAVENYEGPYGIKNAPNSGLKSAPVRIPSFFL